MIPWWAAGMLAGLGYAIGTDRANRRARRVRQAGLAGAIRAAAKEVCPADAARLERAAVEISLRHGA